MPLLGGLLGGRLGNARGSITIDTSGAEQASLTMRRVGQTISNAFAGLERKAHTFSAEINKVNRELTALGIAGGIISAMGIKTAASFEEAGVMLTGMTGSLDKANDLVEQLRTRAREAGVPFNDLLEASRVLLPSLERDTEALQTWLDISRRVAVLNPQQGIAGAAFAINEAMASGGTNFISLANRFNISRKLIQEAMKETDNDFAAALDIVLTKMGITQQAAEAMGKTFNASFNAARDAAMQLLAEGFKPLLDILTPILSQTAEWLGQIREAHPEVGALGAAFATIVTVGAPTLLFLNQVAQSLERIKSLKAAATLGPMLGKAAVGLGAVTIGAGIGVEVGRGIGRATGNEQLANATIQDALRTLGQIATLAAASLATAFTEVAKVVNSAKGWLVDGFAGIVDALGRFIVRILDLIPGPDVGVLGDVRKLGEDLLRGADEMRTWADNTVKTAAELDAGRAAFVTAFGQFLGVLPQAAQDLAAGAKEAGEAARFTPEQGEAIADWGQRIQEIERSANEQRLSATQQYENQRTEIIRSYELTLARDAEDFARQRARQAAQLAKDIADIRADAAARERQWQRELNERIADIRAEGNKRIAQIEEEGQRNLERMRRDHRIRLMEAAANLDARAVAEEQRNFQNQITEAEAEQQRRIQQERENLQERIDQEREAHQKRIEAARAADEERIADMQAALAEQQALEDEDRAIRLARMQEDHEAQLKAMAEAQKERINQINENAAEERDAAWEGLLERLDDLKFHNQAWLDLQKERQDQSIKMFDTFWQSWLNRMATRTSTITTPSAPQAPTTGPGSAPSGPGGGPMLTRQAGGPVYGTGAAMLHGSRSRPEYVLSAETTSLLRGALGGAFNQRQLVGAVAGGRSINIQSGAFSMPIYAAAGQSPTDIAHQVEQVLTGFFRRLTE